MVLGGKGECSGVSCQCFQEPYLEARHGNSGNTTPIFDYFSLGYKRFNDCSHDFNTDSVATEKQL